MQLQIQCTPIELRPNVYVTVHVVSFYVEHTVKPFLFFKMAQKAATDVKII
jgi:hypothetical protein